MKNVSMGMGGVAALALTAGTAMGQFVPALVPETSGLSSGFRALPRQHESYYNASNFTAITSATSITGIRYRLFRDPATNGVSPLAAPSWPAAPLSFGSFELQLGRPSAGIDTDGEIASTSTSFAANMQGAVTVFSGPLTIPAGAFPNDGTTTTPASWGLQIDFTTPYTYNPGEGLMVYIKHSGFGGSQNVFFANGDYANGVADAVSALDNTSANPSGFSSPYVTQFIPAPASAALLGMSLLAAGRRRRQA